MRRLGWTALTTATCTACTLLVGTSDLSGENAPSPGADAQSDAQGGPDAMVDAPPPVSCDDPAIVVCERFDDEAAVGGRYGKVEDVNTTVTSSDTMSVSPPRSAVFTIRPSTNNTSPDATLTMRPNGGLADFAVEGVFFIARREPGQQARLLNVSSQADAGSDEPIQVNQSGDVRNGNTVTNVGEFAVGRWVSIRLEVRSGVQPAQARLVVDGVEKPFAFPAGWKPSEIAVKFGVSEANSPTTGWLVYWDDVVIRKL